MNSPEEKETPGPCIIIRKIGVSSFFCFYLLVWAAFWINQFAQHNDYLSQGVTNLIHIVKVKWENKREAVKDDDL